MIWFYSIATIVGHLMLNPLYTYILSIYDLVWLGFMAYQPLLVILCQILLMKNKEVADSSRGGPEGSFFNSYYTEV